MEDQVPRVGTDSPVWPGWGAGISRLPLGPPSPADTVMAFISYFGGRGQEEQSPHCKGWPQQPREARRRGNSHMKEEERGGGKKERHKHPDRDPDRHTDTERHCVPPDERSRSSGWSYSEILNTQLYQKSAPNEERKTTR